MDTQEHKEFIGGTLIGAAIMGACFGRIAAFAWIALGVVGYLFCLACEMVNAVTDSLDESWRRR